MRRLLRDRSGAAAIEFAIVAVPFLILLLGLFEVGFVFVGNLTLEHSVADAARWVRTGQAQSWDEDTLRQKVCDQIVIPVDCDKLRLDIRTFNAFGDTSFPDPLNDEGKLRDDFTFDTGGRNDVVVLRAYYEWPLISIFPSWISLGNMSSGNRLLSATSVFRNEPF
ncbi:TadE/TadG family type IV pilus assembly protein [Methyloligella sp. 2.7D]|uniref:TadE/TadG family type IV pilus assembly protein n=1 Tax=unclassified Methyloligella TaxID=2625955 RepID=UPI00157E2580|nr:TadE/TadG family type IV pilus assembly protein [Methyloligella sp. GL2]QKP78593.1 pilus assembly protein [Methyloligella sp. GL2]